MLSFLAVHPKRTKVAHLQTLSFDDGASSIEFKAPSDRYLVINRWPPAASEEQTMPGKAQCALSPRLHWHRYQTERFHVLAGTARFTLEREQILAKAGEIVNIPVGAFHTFCNASTTERMEIEFTLEPLTRKRDEAFFRNLQTYRDDTRKAAMRPSWPQILLFMRKGDTFLALPGPKVIAKPLAVLIHFVGGVVIGKWLLGYSDTYPEYSHPSTE
ncbi:hypothetical protein E2P81_ATG10713 [Venturia nashicola]|nr:hypothetical protein E2P81_ATG10713 [Venturia nashicola]